jgi:hypothetical protein
VRVVYRGVWTHGLGPDFSGAYLDLGGRLVQGDVEIHVRASEWVTHGHHLDPAYNGVVLHVVLDDDLAGPPRRQNGGTVTTLELARNLPGPPENFPIDPTIRPLGAIGFDHCAPRVMDAWPDALRAVWEAAGDRRMDAKVNVIAGRLALEPPALTLYALLLDAMGFSQNRAAMTELAGRLPYDHLLARMAGQSKRDGWERAGALLLGVGGFLPLSPREAEFAELSGEQVRRIERSWESLGAAWRDARLPSNAWQLARVRPASHPLRRLLAMATLLSRGEPGLIETVCALVEQPDAYSAAQAWLTGENRYLGQTHAHEIIVNVIVPFALAYGDASGQERLVERTGELWRRIPAGRGNAECRRTAEQICGPRPLPSRSARAEQGLLHLRRTGCAQMRCFECPVAHLALRFERETGSLVQS